MTVIATADDPKFNVSRVDIDRDGPTYTIDTLKDLGSAHPDTELYFITGADALGNIFTWRNVDELFSLANFVGCTRPGYTMDPDMLAPPAVRPDHPGRDPGTGDLVPTAVSARERGGAGLVPRAGRRRPVHRQARPLPRGG